MNTMANSTASQENCSLKRILVILKLWYHVVKSWEYQQRILFDCTQSIRMYLYDIYFVIECRVQHCQVYVFFKFRKILHNLLKPHEVFGGGLHLRSLNFLGLTIRKIPIKPHVIPNFTISSNSQRVRYLLKGPCNYVADARCLLKTPDA